MGLILDLIIIGIVIIFALLSIKRGFVRTIIEIIGFLFAIIFANKVCPILAGFTYDKLLEPTIIKSLSGMSFNSNSLSAIEEGIPDFILNLLGNGFNLQNFQSIINENISNGLETAVMSASQTVIKPIIAQVLTLIYTIFLTTILLLIVSILARIINKLFSFSFVGKINKVLGAGLGVIKGIIISAIFCTIIALVVSVTENGFLIFTQANIDSSYIFKLLCFTIKI